MNLAELFKKNIVMIPVVVSILVGTFTGIKYVINLTDTINSNKDEIIALQEVEITNLKRDLKVVQEANTELKQRLGRAEATFTENWQRRCVTWLGTSRISTETSTETNDKTVHLDRRLGICHIHDLTDHQIRST